MRGPGDRSLITMAAFVAGLTVFALPALADEAAYCVSCQGPDQTYICRVTGDDVHKSDAMKLYCVVRTAKEGSHSTCAARGDITGCNGIEKIYAYSGPALPDAIAEDPRVKGIAEKIEREQKAFDKYEEQKGKSLAAVTGRAWRASGRGIRNMRESISGGDEATQNQSPLPPAAPPMDRLPQRQASAAPSLPLSAAAEPAPLPMAMPLAEEPPASPGRLRRGAQNVGGFARNSYRCVRSLFRHCRSEPEALSAPN